MSKKVLGLHVSVQLCQQGNNIQFSALWDAADIEPQLTHIDGDSTPSRHMAQRFGAEASRKLLRLK